MNPLNWIAWFLNKQASWGLLPTEWWDVPNLQMIVGFIAGVMLGGFGLIVTGVKLMDFFDDESDRFDDNTLTQTGYWVFAVVAAAAVAVSVGVCGGVVGFCAASLLIGLLFENLLLTLIGLLALGPLLIVVGKLRSRRPNLTWVKNLRPRFKKSAPKQEPASSQEEILSEEFHTVEFDGVPILRPN